MKKKPQSEAEWLRKLLIKLNDEFDYNSDLLIGRQKFVSPRLIAALKRRGWTPPMKGRK